MFIPCLSHGCGYVMCISPLTTSFQIYGKPMEPWRAHRKDGSKALLPRWFMVGLWWVYGDQWVIHLVGDWAYPSEQILEWVSSVGMLTFPTEWKVVKFHGSKPPTRYHPCYIFGLEWLNLMAHDTFLVVATSPSWLWEPPQWLVYGYNVRPPFDS